MIQLAIIDLKVPGTEQFGRVFLDRGLFTQRSIADLEKQLGHEFNDPEDVERMTRIREIFSKRDKVVLSIYPGEEPPPAYFVYLRDPEDADTELFACVLAPPALVRLMVEESRATIFETASFQVLSDDTTFSALQAAIETWIQRVWPELDVPRLEIRPWPIEEVYSQPSLPPNRPTGVPKGAPACLPQTDFPTVEELRA